MAKDSNKKTYAMVAGGVALCAAVAAAATYITYRKQENENEDDSFKPSAKAVLKKEEVAAKSVEKPAEKTIEKPAVAPSAASKNASAVLSEKKVAPPSAPVNAVADTTPKTDFVEFKEYFCGLCPSAGWVVANEPAPMPNIAMIVMRKPEFAEVENPMPGTVPAVLLSIEDISNENLSVEEMKNKSKEIATQQLAMMTGGAMSPEILFDGPKRVGPFEYCLEFRQAIPPFMNLQILNYFTVKNGLAYTFQYIANPSVFKQYLSVVMETMSTVVIKQDQSVSASDFTADSYVRTTCKDVQVSTHPSWIPEQGTGRCILRILTASQEKPERIDIFEEKDAPNVPKGATRTCVNGIDVATFMEGGVETKVASHNGFSAVLKPTKLKTCFLDLRQFCACVKTLTQSDEPNQPSVQRHFFSARYGLDFPVPVESGFSCSKIGCGTIIYAPAGIKSLERGEDVPYVTIRIGHPDTEDSCEPTLEAWRAKLMREDAGITRIDDATLCGLPAISFNSKEMVDQPDGQKQENTCKVILTVRPDGTTVLVRWEGSTGSWRKFDRDMNKMIKKLNFF